MSDECQDNPPDLLFPRYTIPQTTIDGPALDPGVEAALVLHVVVDDDWAPREPVTGEHVQPPFTLHVRDWAGPWKEPLNPTPNPLGDAARELRDLRAKWAAKGVSITGRDDDGTLVVNYKRRYELVHTAEVRLRLLRRGSPPA